MIEQPSQALRNTRGKSNPAGASQQERVQIKVRRISVIVRGVLEIHAILLYVTRHLLEQDSDPQFPPPSGIGHPGQRRTKVQESQRLAGQMGIWRKVIREVRFDIRRVLDQAL